MTMKQELKNDNNANLTKMDEELWLVKDFFFEINQRLVRIVKQKYVLFLDYMS